MTDLSRGLAPHYVATPRQTLIPDQPYATSLGYGRNSRPIQTAPTVRRFQLITSDRLYFSSATKYQPSEGLSVLVSALGHVYDIVTSVTINRQAALNTTPAVLRMIQVGQQKQCLHVQFHLLIQPWVLSILHPPSCGTVTTPLSLRRSELMP